MVGEVSYAQNQEPPHELRPEQLEAVQAVAQARHDGVGSGYVNMATGLGKTLVAAEDAKAFCEETPEARVLYLCHNSDILRQARGTFSQVFHARTHGNLFGGEFEDQEDIVYATFQTLGRKLGGGKVYEAYDEHEFDYVVVDESHHGPAETYRPIIEYFKPKFLLGLTATPERRDQQDIGEIFGQELHAVLLEDAIANGYLAKPDYNVLTDHVRRLQEVHIESGPLTLSRLNREVFVRRRDEEIADIIAEHLGRREDPRSIVFCPTIEYAEHMSSLLPGRVATLHSKLDPKLQEERLKQFKSGELDMVVTVDKLNEGVDVPEANALIFLRSTESRTVFLQQLGRGLRKIPGKEDVLVLDFVATWERIDMVRNLIRGVQQSRSLKHGVKPHHADTPFKFAFSQEVLDAIDIIKSVREGQKSEAPAIPQRELDKMSIESMLHAGIPDELTESQTASLGLRLSKGDGVAKEDFLLGHLTSLYGIARFRAESLGRPELVEDLFQDACVTLLDSLGEYDPQSSYPGLKAFSGSRVHARFNADIYRRYELFHVPVHNQKELDSIEKKKSELEEELGRTATSDEMAEATGMDAEKVDDLLVIQDAVSNPQSADQLKLYSDVLAGRRDMESRVLDSVQSELLHRVLQALPYRERTVLEMHLGLAGQESKTLSEIAGEFNITTETARIIKQRVYKKLETLPEFYQVVDTKAPKPRADNLVITDDGEVRAMARRLGYRVYGIDAVRALVTSPAARDRDEAQAASILESQGINKHNWRRFVPSDAQQLLSVAMQRRERIRHSSRQTSIYD